MKTCTLTLIFLKIDRIMYIVAFVFKHPSVTSRIPRLGEFAILLTRKERKNEEL